MFNLQNLPRHTASYDLETKRANAASHRIGNVDDCRRCIDCEIGVWNAWKEMCWNV